MTPAWGSPGLPRHDALVTLVTLTMTLTLVGVGGNQESSSAAEAGGGGGNPRRMQCNVAQQNCMARVGCSMALHNYLLNCAAVMHGRAGAGCPARCRKALVSLFSTEDSGGEAFMECDCNGNTYCHTQKQRLEVCSRDVFEAMKRLNDDSVQVSCSLAELICRADTSCLAATQFFEMNCAKLQSGDRCTARCNNSVSILLRQKKARQLRTCVCDGTETYACDTVQEGLERLCYHGRRTPSKPRHWPHHNHNHTRGRHHNNRGQHQNATHGAGQGGSDGNALPDGGRQPAGCSNTSSDVGSHCVSSSASSALGYGGGISHSSRTRDVSVLVTSAMLVLLAYRLR